MAQSPADAPPRPPRRRRPARGLRALRQLALVAVGFVLLEWVLRAAGLGPAPSEDGDPYVGFDGSLPLFVAEGEAFVTAPYKRNHFNLQTFPATKHPEVTRVVCLGGSTTYGRPYTDATSFPGWLRELLPRAAPGRRFEVVNAGGISYASYRVAVVLEEVLTHDPDLVVIYTGHNEFLEERTYAGLRQVPSAILALGNALRRTALFAVARGLLGGEGAPAAAGPADGAEEADAESDVLAGEVSTILDRSVGPEAYTRDDPWRAAVLEHLGFNLDRMARLCAEASVPLLLVAPASQLRDCRPFKSEHTEGLDPEVAREVDEALARGVDDLPTLQRLAAADPRHAALQYALAQARDAAGDVNGAGAAYRRARDEDIVPLRAPSEVAPLVLSTAAAHGLPAVDARAVVGDLARVPGQPGAEVFLDHVHMTIEAYRALALAIIEGMARAGLVDTSPGWEVEAVPAVSDEVLAQVDDEAHVRALSRLAAVLDWAGKREEARALTERALLRSGGGDALSQWQLGNYRLGDGDLEGALEAYDRATDIDPEYLEAHGNAASVLLQLGRTEQALARFDLALVHDEARAASHFGRAVALDRLGRTAEAEAAYRRTLELDPEDLDARNRLGILLLRDGRRDLAESTFRALLERAPDFARAHYNLGLLLAATDRADQARAAWRDTLTHDPDHQGAHARLGLALHALGRADEAREHLLAARALDPGDRAVAAALRDLGMGDG